jgi:hypothetical protein
VAKKKKNCQARDCEVVIKPEYVFCKYHWSLLPCDNQDEVAEAWHTEKWYRAIAKARALIKEEESNIT